MSWNIFTKIAILACLLCVSSARAAVLLDWQNGTLTGTAPTGVVPSTQTTIPYQFTVASGGGSISITLSVLPGYEATDLYVNWTTSANRKFSYTVNNTEYQDDATGSFGLLSILGTSGGSSTGTINVTGIPGGNGQRVTFTDVQISGTITAVPEPVNVALGVFFVCAVAVGVGRRIRLKGRSRIARWSAHCRF